MVVPLLPFNQHMKSKSQQAGNSQYQLEDRGLNLTQRGELK
jgi:hypothetical protein